MKYVKTFESYNNDIKLDLRITDDDEYHKAVEFFNNKSVFYPESTNDEFNSISFQCTNQDDADVTEKGITDELIKNNFDDFYFEQE